MAWFYAAEWPTFAPPLTDTDGPFEMHHPHRLKDKRRGPLTPWVQSARRRRTIVLCHKCHVAHHGGRMPDRMESRVH
ncbi:HNH endonuclease [Sphingobium sp. CAP-1]|uniref:HNH endonuclease n=1 Tax=Sphingobium sp. CAP-1 TaxID=2676077 RepID=UPI003FA770FC